MLTDAQVEQQVVPHGSVHDLVQLEHPLVDPALTSRNLLRNFLLNRDHSSLLFHHVQEWHHSGRPETDLPALLLIRFRLLCAHFGKCAT